MGKSTFYVVPGQLGTKPVLLTSLERIVLWKALGVVLRKGAHPDDCRGYRRLYLRMGHSLGMRSRRSA